MRISLHKICLYLFFNAAIMPISIGCFQDVTFGGKNFTVTFNLVSSFECEGALSSKSRTGRLVRSRTEGRKTSSNHMAKVQESIHAFFWWV